MNRRRHSVLIIGLVVGAILATMAFSGDPSYHGKDLQQWSAQLVATTRSDSPLFRSTAAGAEAVHAIQSIGPKAIPFALRKLAYRKSELRSRASIFLRKIGIPSKQPKEEFFVRSEGVNIFYHLGDSGRDAVPALIRLAKAPSYCPDAARALSCVGSRGLEALSQLLTDQNTTVRRATIVALLGFIERQDVPGKSLERVIQAINDPDPTNQKLVSDWLLTKSELSSNLSGDVTMLLTNPKPVIRAAAAKSLGFVGPLREDTTAALASKLQDPELIVRQAATNALIGKTGHCGGEVLKCD